MPSGNVPEMMDEIATPDVKPLDRNEVEGVLRAMRQLRYQANPDMPKRKTGGFQKRSLAELAMAAQAQPQDKAENLAESGTQSGDTTMTAGASDAVPADAEIDMPAIAGDTPQQLDVGDEPQALADNALSAEEAASAEKIEAARQAGIAEGKAMAQAEAEAEAFQNIEVRAQELQAAQKDELLERLEQLADALMSPMALDADALAASLEAAVERLAYARIGAAIGDMPEVFVNRIADLVAQVRQQNETAIVSLNERDYDLLVPLLEQRPAFARCTFERNSSLQHGDIRIVFGAISFEDILADRLGLGEAEAAPEQLEVADVETPPAPENSENTPESELGETDEPADEDGAT